MSISPLQTTNIFHKHFIMWRILGFTPTKKYRQFYIIYSIALNIFATIGCPLHLMIGLFQSKTLYDVIENLAINLTCLVCSIKNIVIWLEFKYIKEIHQILKRQDKRIVQSRAEVEYYKVLVFKKVRRVFNIFIALYLSSFTLIESSVLIKGLVMGNWTLLYPGYFPFDPYATTKLYTLAHIYPYFAIGIQVLQDIANDSFVTMHLALLSGHVHCLNMRVRNLSCDENKSKAINNAELLECIQDHKDLLLYRLKLEKLISVFMFFQMFIASINMCAIIVFIILFTTDPFTLAYYFVYLLSMILEIAPACYYGSSIEIEFKSLTYAIFSSNWLKQNAQFKKNSMIFAEISKKPLSIKAWLIPINLNSFLAVSKNAYSLFALIMNLK